jgi:hypothetical protein
VCKYILRCSTNIIFQDFALGVARYLIWVSPCFVYSIDIGELEHIDVYKLQQKTSPLFAQSKKFIFYCPVSIFLCLYFTQNDIIDMTSLRRTYEVLRSSYEHTTKLKMAVIKEQPRSENYLYWPVWPRYWLFFNPYY